MENKVDLKPYTVNVQGKDFVTFAGLLKSAHAIGLTSIHTELLNEDLTNPIFKAKVRIGDKEFTGYGDANVDNVAKQVKGALIRMAETRALARALRFACNIDMAALEELPGDSNTVLSKKSYTSKNTFGSNKKATMPSKSITKSVTKPIVKVIAKPTPKVIEKKVVEEVIEKVEVPTKRTFGKRAFSKPVTEPEF